MKFEDMKKIWDEQREEHVYVINEQQLHENIKARKQGASRMVNKIELFLLAVNGITGATLITLNYLDRSGDVLFGTLMGLFLLGVAVFILARRRKRLRHENRFDRTMLGDINHAIENATYQVRLSYAMLLTVVPVFAIAFLGAWKEGKSPLVLGFIGIMFVLAFLLGRWEHRGLHVARKKRLEAIREKLTSEN